MCPSGPGLTTQGPTFDASGTMYVADTALRSIDRVNSSGSGHTGYVLRQTLTASTSGRFSTTYIAGDDYRYYAQVGSTVSAGVLTQAAPTLAGPLGRVVKKNSTVVLKGTGVAGSTVRLHFHKAGTEATDYSIVRDVVVASNGTWNRPYVALVDYRLFASSTLNATTTSTYLVQAR